MPESAPQPRDLVLRDRDGTAFAATSWASGRASAVVIVHGLLGTRRLREIVRVAEALRDRHDVLAIDVLGHGDTSGKFTWGREEWKQVVAAARHAGSGLRPVHAVGFSYGGYHVVRAAARGAPLARLVLVGAPVDRGVFDHFPLGPNLWRHLPAVARRGRRRLRAELPPRLAASALPESEIRSVSCPALVVHGGADWLVSARHAARYAAELPRAERRDVPGGFHGEYLVDSHGEVLIDAIRGFLGPWNPGDDPL